MLWSDAAMIFIPWALSISFYLIPFSSNGKRTNLTIPFMQRYDLLRRQTQVDIAVQPSDNATETSASLWTPLADQLISIIGDGGFDSLYDRSLYLTQSTYPWLGASSGSPQSDSRFASLKASLEGQALAREANLLLLITFTDILASLVGEPLTARILDSAWDHDGQIKAAKELNK